LDKLAKKGLSFSLIVGTLLVPLTALAAIWMTDPGRGTEEASATTPVGSVATVTTTPITAGTNDIAADIQTACGREGMELVSLEESASITGVQQAALDALREVCEQQGIPLPARPVADAIVQTVIVPAGAAASQAPGRAPTTLDEDHDYEDDEYEDRDDREDDDQGDVQDGHEDEGDEHEDGD
jgi:hypothetical protein